MSFRACKGSQNNSPCPHNHPIWLPTLRHSSTRHLPLASSPVFLLIHLLILLLFSTVSSCLLPLLFPHRMVLWFMLAYYVLVHRHWSNPYQSGYQLVWVQTQFHSLDKNTLQGIWPLYILQKKAIVKLHKTFPPTCVKGMLIVTNFTPQITK